MNVICLPLLEAVIHKIGELTDYRDVSIIMIFRNKREMGKGSKNRTRDVGVGRIVCLWVVTSNWPGKTNCLSSPDKFTANTHKFRISVKNATSRKYMLYKGEILVPIQVKYLDNGIGVMFIGTGIVAGDDIINANREVFSSEARMENYKYGFIDYSVVSDLSASNSEIEHMVSQQKKASEFMPNAILAFVAKKDLEFGLTRMWEIIADNASIQWETMVFRDKEKAEIWIKDRMRKIYNIDITMI